VKNSYDAVIVGARCAGAATAMLLARSGLSVLAVERAAYGADTLSTHALARAGVLQLSRWGLLAELERAETPAVRETRFAYADRSVVIPIVARDGVNALYAPRRTLLDRLLVDGARAAGAQIVHRTRLVALLRSRSGRVRGAIVEDARGKRREIAASIVVGADGIGSSVARRVGATTYHTGRHAAAHVYGYFRGLVPEGYRFFYQPGLAVSLFPTNGKLCCVCVSLTPAALRRGLASDLDASYRQWLARGAPSVARALGSATAEGGLQVFSGRRGYFRQSAGPGWALVGDAGYFRDPITAHGMTDALRDAELCARAIANGTERALAEYQATRDGLSEEFFRATDAVASFEWDLPALERLHVALARATRRENETLVGLPALERARLGCQLSA
jgi:menaquinone-9 beta-reductase